MHTPGPWKFLSAFGRVEADREIVAYISGAPAEAISNGLLIAQAPEMAKVLEATRHLLKSYEYGNSAPEPAKDMADRIELLLKEIGIEIRF